MKALRLKSLPKPAGHRVLIKPDKVETVSAGGIITDISNGDREADAQIIGTLVAVGPNAWKEFDDGIPWAQVGEKVLFAKYGGYAVKIRGEVYRIMNDEDVTAIVSDDEVSEADHG